MKTRTPIADIPALAGSLEADSHVGRAPLRDLALSRIDARQSLSVASYDLFFDPVDPLYILRTDAGFMGLLC